jgi:hypothetical protein
MGSSMCSGSGSRSQQWLVRGRSFMGMGMGIPCRLINTGASSSNLDAMLQFAPKAAPQPALFLLRMKCPSLATTNQTFQIMTGSHPTPALSCSNSSSFHPGPAVSFLAGPTPHSQHLPAAALVWPAASFTRDCRRVSSPPCAACYLGDLNLTLFSPDCSTPLAQPSLHRCVYQACT